MNNFINYILESGISLGALALIYFVFLRNETFFKANRLFLLSAVVFSSLLPLLHFKIYGAGNQLNLTATGTPNMLETITVSSHGITSTLINLISTSNLLIYGYLLVSGVVALIVLFRVFQLVRMVRKGQLVQKDGISYVYLNDNSSPYSFLDYLFVSRNLETKPGWEKMLAHESEHIRQGHTVDILILELISVFQWFNPFFWLLRRVIKENHEYMADQAVLNRGVGVNQYKEILVTQFIGEQFSIANNFNSSLIKSRLKMMTRIKSSNKAKSRYLIGVLTAIVLIVFFACEEKESAVADTTVELKSATSGQPLTVIDGEIADKEAVENLDVQKIESVDVLKGENAKMIEKYGDLAKNGVIMITLKPDAENAQKSNEVELTDNMEDVFFVVDEMPEFPGGELALRKFIAQKIEYPTHAQENGIQGKVYISFVVEKDGSVRRAKVVRGVDPALDLEALRVIKESPVWTPGKQKGEAVAVSYTVPINFVLQ